MGFWTLSIVLYSRKQKIRRFGNWICFCPQVRGKTPTQLGPLERANLNHWTFLRGPTEYVSSSSPEDGTDPISETSCFYFL
jgi:hypothetical protein